MKIISRIVLSLVLLTLVVYASENQNDQNLFIIQISIATILISMFAFLNHQKLKSMVQEKTNEMKILLNSFDKNVIASKTDTDGKITYVSQAFCDISGYKESELLGSYHGIVRHPDMENEIFSDMWTTIISGKTWIGEIKNLKKNGDFYWVNAIVSPEYDKDGKLIGYDAIRQNITDKKEVEDLTKNLEEKVEDRTSELLWQKLELENKQQEVAQTYQKITESIDYAALIQNTLIPDSNHFMKYFKDSFTIWQPKDVVGGDIYLFEALRNDNESLLLVIDCTGHGVPGAFVTMLIKAIERQLLVDLINTDGEISTAYILQFFNTHLTQILSEHHSSKSIAGFDGGLIYYNKKQNIIKYSGANTPLFIVQNDDISTIKGDRYSIGINANLEYKFTEHTIDIKDGLKVYLSTDGFLDQTGGKKDFPFSKRRFLELIELNHTKPMHEQKDIYLNALEVYKDEQLSNEYNDDITMVALEISPSYSNNYTLNAYSSIDTSSDDYNIFFAMDSIVTQRLVVTTVEKLEEELESIEDISSKERNNLIYIAIELIQNLISYSNRLYDDRAQFNSTGICNIGYSKKEEKYFVSTVNFVRNIHTEKLKTKLDHIVKLEKDELRSLMKELRRSGEDKHSRGAGLGIIEIARKSTQIDYKLTEVNKLESACEIIVYL